MATEINVDQSTLTYLIGILTEYVSPSMGGREEEQAYNQVRNILKIEQNYEIDDLITKEDRKKFLLGEYASPSPGVVTNQVEDVGAKIILAVNGADFEVYSTDEYARYVAEACLANFLGVPLLDSSSVDEYANLIKTRYSRTATFANINSVIADFVSNKYIFDTENTLEIFSSLAVMRLETWFSVLQANGTLDPQKVIDAESKLIQETTISNSPGNSNNPIVSSSLELLGQNALNIIATKLYKGQNNNPTFQDIINNAKQMKVGDFDAEDQNAFFRVFSSVDLAVLNQYAVTSSLSDAAVATLMKHLDTLGLLQLAAYAGDIANFAKRRAASVASIQKSASEYAGNNPTDLAWFLKLGEVMQSVRANPVIFATVKFYFPSLITFLLDAIAVIADYSNGGKGGGAEDPVNDPDAQMAQLLLAFGSKNGKPVFEFATSLTNTADKIKDIILNKSPFRANIQPANPDIFHLRLGAANFFVPPLTIDINSNFKAGSLMSSALRQKNSPKFNSGYKETAIRMRLFFPNYEEIWGLSLDDAAEVQLNKNMVIDFSQSGSTEEVIDKFLSSLRGLIAAFKYSPFLPIKNHYLNAVHGITAVGLANLTISTIPNFPFALAVDLELVNFNHKPFLPMLSDFNQAIHWGKYRQYMGKASVQLNKYVNEEFLIKTSDTKEQDTTGSVVVSDEQVVPETGISPTTVVWTGSEWRPVAALPDNALYIPQEQLAGSSSSMALKTNLISQWRNGNHLTLYAPAETQTKLFLPSTSSFRTEEEKMMTDLGQATWQNLLGKFGIDLNESAGYGLSLAETMDSSRDGSYLKSTKTIIDNSLDILLAGVNSNTEIDKLYDYLTNNFIIENISYFNEQTEEGKNRKLWLKDRTSDITEYPTQMNFQFQGKYVNSVSLNAVKAGLINLSLDPSSYLDYMVDKAANDISSASGLEPDFEKIKDQYKRAFNVSLYERFFQSGTIQSIMETARAKSGMYQFNEWEVPMLRVDLDPESVIINGVTVSMGNNLVRLHLQMQDEPTYQHIGGKDSYINISMTIIGETELIKFKKVFDHISALARLEHATGVIGFLGIKNIITALSGIKYVMPLTYNVSTRPNYPHIYDVQLTLVDFDIFQQKREELSSKQQKQFIEHFKSKRNPFLRIKQLWGAFNAYPDFPLQVTDNTGEVVGTLDPDYYFRSFSMFDDDVVFNLNDQLPRVQEFAFEDPVTIADIGLIATINDKILTFLSAYKPIVTTPAESSTQRALLQEMIDFIQSVGISRNQFIDIFRTIIKTDTTGFTKEVKLQLLTDFIEFDNTTNEESPFFMQEISPARFQLGNVSANDAGMLSSIEAAIAGAYSLATEQYVSFHPDEVDFHKQIFSIPAASQDDVSNNQIPSIMSTALGVHFGYIDRTNGRFYLTIANENVSKSSPDDPSFRLTPNYVEDTQTPDKGTTQSMTGVYGVTPLSEYQKPENDSSHTHWETMLVDTKYRDMSGRMIRAFPTYMLWLIDEGGYFAGAKLFDNFYGLQSIIDFSVVSSEDLLGDTLIFRLSNLYSKLTTKPSDEIFDTGTDAYIGDELSMQQQLSGIIQRTLDMSRNIISGMRNEYIVDIKNIRLKPGVRVHLRGGYGSNPNSLQTLFNGVITNVEQGEIVTVTAQSDAIELGAVINSTNKKGDSGKVDGGVDTGMYLSEPRDLMVRLLSMGTSRFREGIAHAVQGTVFSENKFGIRHFGSILYEPLSEDEANRTIAITDKISEAYSSIGGSGSINGFSSNIRGGTLSIIGQLWSNFNSQVDLEIFKRNIYPGNGLGIAQFLGGDIDDGWSTVSSLVPMEGYNERSEGYLGRLTDITYNKMIQKYQEGDNNAQETLDALTKGNILNANEGRADLVKNGISLAGIAVGAATAILGMPVAGGAVATAGLLGVLSGRGGTNIFRTMGIIAPNADDDLSGFDEVSFRAQTYMRTVWDIFEVCAKLLPNYIVAVRPFEDRSTVFYGKPHWLYTSGVVPVTTGFPSEEKAVELGISSGPRLRQPDQVLAELLRNINQGSNPLADINAYFSAFEPNETLQSVAKDILESTGIFSPTSYFAGKIIDFFSESTNTFLEDGDNGTSIIAKLPVNKGKATVGPHLPIITKESIDNPNSGETLVEGSLANQLTLHKQIGNLPPRYAFPYFVINETYKLENSSSIRIPPVASVIFGGSAYHPFDMNNYDEEYNNLSEVIKLEVEFFSRSKYTLIPSPGDDTIGTVNLETPLALEPLLVEAKANFNVTGSYISMPVPAIGRVVGNINFGDAAQYSDKLSFEYDEDSYAELTYQEWGAPTNAYDEQFYIAMRWPYNPGGVGIAKDLDSTTKEKFKQTYGFTDLYGVAEDYKNRKVLVYNPANGRAVVCKPAYFLWGEGDVSDDIAARVSPDAAYFLGILTVNDTDPVSSIEGTMYGNDDEDKLADYLLTVGSGIRAAPVAQECLYAFVPDEIPVGVLAKSGAPAVKLSTVNPGGAAIANSDQDYYTVSFGNFIGKTGATPSAEKVGGAMRRGAAANDPFRLYKLFNADYTSTVFFDYGGNPINLSDTGLTYFQAVIDKQFEVLQEEELANRYEQTLSNNVPASFSLVPIYDASSLISVQARQYYDERYDPSVSVIAGNGRTAEEASEIWNAFRNGYHNSSSVKKIFFDIYGLDPDVDDDFPEIFKDIISGTKAVSGFLDYFKSGENKTAEDEFQILMGSDYGSQMTNGNLSSTSANYLEAIEFMRKNFIDASLDDGGLINSYNNLMKTAISRIADSFFSYENITFLKFLVEANGDDLDPQKVKSILSNAIRSPKQLFLFMVGIFRQRMWEDPYARAWVVLKPDRNAGWFSADGWSFKPIDKVFRAFIDPYQDYAKPSKKAKFLQLLVSTRGEGNSETTYFGEIQNSFEDLYNKTIGPIVGAVGEAISGLISTFKLSMQQLGYALSEVGNFKRQANILNKALNDSIYYSLGRPGSVLRAVDNPFTREYGEPVIEIREPFQRLHYISSFSHILSNQIQENINGVATTITAVSDGKYPVTVALDKAAPAERQVEKTVETGLYFDNFIGSGFTGFLHPLMHPLETFRGIAKTAQGTPDELSARRIALAHLKESIKDIYGGELILIGNADIRPHDLVYLADVYERMYGIFEVEQVIHHFTPELGFITSITPNALVTVNDPSRWFRISWLHSWMNVQNIRNDTRIYMDNIRASKTGFTSGDNISIDRLGEILSTQIIGGIQFTHGSSALVKDIIANQTAQIMPDQYNQKLSEQAQNGGGVPTFISMGALVPFVGQLAWKGWTWIRDNILDQHGCYVQYLNKNGQPMDAGLSYNQGMVVGQHHSKALLPGVLGVRVKARTAEGNAYIRSDDLFRNLGWNETQISDLNRQISYHTALVNARVLELSGLGPEKAGFEWKFKVICKVIDIIDGDTIDVQDIISKAIFRIRFNGINTSETNTIEGKIDTVDSSNTSEVSLSILDISTPGGAAKLFVKEALKDRIFVVRLNQTRTDAQVSSDGRAVLSEDFEAGSTLNNLQNYQLDIFGREPGNNNPRALGVIFYYAPQEAYEDNSRYIANIFRQNLNNILSIKNIVKQEIYEKSPFYIKFEEIFDSIDELIDDRYCPEFTDENDPLYNLTSYQRQIFSVLVYLKIIEQIYDTAAQWPTVSWDQYYGDGYPMTLNWELVSRNLAKIFIKDLQYESQSVVTASELSTNIVQIF